MPYEYLASVQSAVRRVNDRLKTLADKFGVYSSMLWDAKTQMDVLLGDNFKYKNGVPQLIKPSEIFNNEDKMRALQSLDENIKTWGEYRKSYKESYKRYTDDAELFKETPVEIEEYITTMENVKNAVRVTDSEQFLPQDALEILKVKGRRNTFFELQQVNEILRREGFI